MKNTHKAWSFHIRPYSHHRRFGRRGLKGFTGLLMFALGSAAGLVALTIRPAHAQLSLDNVVWSNYMNTSILNRLQALHWLLLALHSTLL